MNFKAKRSEVGGGGGGAAVGGGPGQVQSGKNMIGFYTRH